MWRVFHFFVLLSYLNILCFDIKYCGTFNFEPVATGETLIEVVLEDFLDLQQQSENFEFIPDIMFDDYRIVSHFLAIIPLVLYFTWLLRKIFASNDKIKHYIYFAKRLIQPDYYTFLYRFRLF